MKTEPIIRALGLKKLTTDAPEDFSGIYAGDFLSRAMSHVREGDLWITIMSNVNVIAVASLTDAAAVILAEDVTMDEDVIAAANEKEIAVYSSDLTVYELCVKIGREISD